MLPLSRYPKEISLHDGTRLLFRPMEKADVDALWAFFQLIPEKERIYFRDDVSRKETVERWGERLDYGQVLPILAFDGKRVVGDATLHRFSTGWKRRVGMVRIQVAPDFRHRGLGTAMIRELRHVGEKAGFAYLTAEIVEEQTSAIRAFESLGFEKAVVFRRYVCDQNGEMRDLVVLNYAMVGDRGPDLF